jgi:transposase-like protein
MQCPECQSSYVNKNGHKKGKQNYICVNCARQFIDCYQPQGKRILTSTQNVLQLNPTKFQCSLL